jgi:HEAT repeat protein
VLTIENGQIGDVMPPACKSRVVTSLRDLLDNGDEVDKCNASRALGSIGATEAIDDLVLKLRDEDIDVCIDAAEALGKLKAGHIVPALLDSLKNDPDGELKTAIVKALGEIEDPRSIPILLEIADHQPEDMHYDSNDDWDNWWDMQQQAVIALGNMKAESAIPVLQKLLVEEETLDIEHDILQALARIGSNGEQIVIDQLKSASSLSRRRAAYALSFSQSPESLKPLAALLRDEAEEVRLSALQALVERKATKYLSAIELLKRDCSEKVRQASILAYNELQPLVDSATTPPSTTHQGLLQDPDAEVRATYLRSLQHEDLKIDDETLRELVHAALNDRDEQVLEAAIPLLLKLPEASQNEALLIELIQRPKLALPLLTICIRTLARLSRWNDSVSQAMTRLINHQDSAVRLVTLQALMAMESDIDALKMGGQENSPIDIVNEALNGRIVLEVEVAAPVAADNSAEEQVQPEVEAPADSAEDEPQQATSTLESIMQDNQRVETSLRAMNNPLQSGVEIDSSLDEYRDLVQDNIVRSEWLFDQKEKVTVACDVQRLAAKVLASIPAHLSAQKTTRIINSLLSALNSSDDKLRCYAADAITQIALDNPKTAGIEYAYGGLVTQFHNEQWDLKLACIRALAAIRNRAAIPILLSALEHQRSALRVQAINSITDLQLNGDALVKHAHVPEQPPTLTEWVNTLIDLLQDAQTGVRYSAVANLKRCLLAEEISRQQELTEIVIEKIVGAAFNNRGGRTRDMALVLKEVAPVQGTENLLQLLDELPGSYERRFAIEMLEEMYRVRPDNQAPNLN